MQEFAISMPTYSPSGCPSLPLRIVCHQSSRASSSLSSDSDSALVPFAESVASGMSTRYSQSPAGVTALSLSLSLCRSLRESSPGLPATRSGCGTPPCPTSASERISDAPAPSRSASRSSVPFPAYPRPGSGPGPAPAPESAAAYACYRSENAVGGNLDSSMHIERRLSAGKSSNTTYRFSLVRDDPSPLALPVNGSQLRRQETVTFPSADLRDSRTRWAPNPTVLAG